MFTRIILLVLALACAGCAHQAHMPLNPPKAKLSGEVSGGVIEPPASARYVREAGAHYELPLASPDNPLPIYPTDLLSKRLPPITVEARVVVDDKGHVVSVASLGQSESDDSPFVESVRSAVRDWNFTQLVKIIPSHDWTTLVDGSGTETQYPGKATALAFHQDYRFVFSQTEGKANVEIRPTANPKH